jgi:hypothetical protein
MGRIAWIILCALRLWGQHAELRIYSEFDQLNESGELVDSIPGRTPQEIISPAVVRNGFTSFHVAVSGRPGILYWFAIQSNPANVFRIRVYKERPDELREELRPMYFLGVMAGSGTDVYLLDVWTPGETPARTVRLEVLVKEAYWVVAPMEVRIQSARAPNLDAAVCCSPQRITEAPDDSFAWEALLTGFMNERLAYIAVPVDMRSVLRRNALQDAALVRSLPLRVRKMLLNRVLQDMLLRFSPGLIKLHGAAETYLPLRRLIIRMAKDLE